MTGQDYINNRELHPFWDASRDPNREDVADAFEQGKAEGYTEAREQMMQGAIETTIKEGIDTIGIFVKGLDIDKYKTGDKVKVITIKED